MNSIPMQRSNPLPFLLIIVIAAAGILALAAVESTVTEQSHAISKHGSSLTMHARQCNQNNDVFQVWLSKSRGGIAGNFAEVCDLNNYDMMDPEKTWSIRIIDKLTGAEVTVFKHTGDLLSLEEYLVRQLYILL